MTMRSASCFILSLALHIGALLYPVSFPDRTEIRFFPVTILSPEPGPRDAPDADSGERPVSRVSSKPVAVAPRPAKSALDLNSPASQPEQHPITAGPGATTSDSTAAITASSRPSDTESAPVYDRTAEAGSVGPDTAGNDAGRDDSPGSFGAETGNGLGTGSRKDSEEAVTGGSIVLIQARYSKTPTPSYPESARRDGREGRVLLRVLVDVQGRAKWVEVNTSSGTEVLDQAAAEAIKRWRFHPARYGDKPVESWIRIPIEFRLASASP